MSIVGRLCQQQSSVSFTKTLAAQGFFTLKSSLYRSLFMGKEQTWNEDGRKDDDGY
ncbi:hypothetical protein BVAD3_11750 [Bacillus velezensis]|nr:hypothetical protein BVAD3_11750 [Bacillus velezensis]